MARARWIARAFVLLLCACLGAGCSDHRARSLSDDSSPPVRGGTLEIVGNSDVDHLATTSAYMLQSSWLIETFARQLVVFPQPPDDQAHARAAPDLAREVPTWENGGISGNGLTYTFHLRRGVRWNTSPPREVTAHDVVRAFKLMLNPVCPVGAPGYYTSTIAGMERYGELFAQVPGTVPAIRAFVNTHEIEGVHAPDDSTVLFRLRTQAPDFLNLVAMSFASPVPAEYLDYLPDSPEFRQHTLSCGPYRIARYVQGREYLLERNLAWDAGTDPLRPAYVDRIRVRLGMDAQLQQLQIEAGTADLSLELIPTAELASLLAIDDATVWLSPPGDAYGGFTYLVVNYVGPNNAGALKRLGVRRAIAVAVDKAAITQLTGGPRLARPLRQAVVSSAAGYRRGADHYLTPGDRGDPALARTLLAEAGCPAGISLRLAYPRDSWFPLAAQALQASLKRAGFDVHLVPSTGADFWGRLLSNPENARSGEWDLALTGWSPDWFGGNNGRSVSSPLFDGRHVGQNSPNYGGYQNPEVDAAIDRALAAPSAELAEAAWSDAARRVMDDVAIVPLAEYKLAYGRSRRVRNCTWPFVSLNCELTKVWLANAAPKSGVAR
jgi:ABC-type transport system substrate-binding protein